MKTFRIYFTMLIFILSISISSAQKFLHKTTDGKKLSFKTMQRQFDDWSKTVNLKKEKHWKYYKRWENDMQFKTNGSGELADPSIYINEAVKIADQRNTLNHTKSFNSAGWSPVGPFTLPVNETGYMQNGIGRINCIAFHPTDPNTYFVGVAQGGLWKTTNDGASWTPLTDNLPITRISDISIDPNNPLTMYISVCDFEYIDVALNLDGRKRNTHYGLGVYKTTDGGATWAPTTLSFLLTDGDASLIRKILVNPSNSNQVVACGVSGMYRSTNAGATWTHVMDTLFWDIQEDPTSPNILYAASGWLAVSGIGNAAIYKSLDFGATWIMLPTGIPATGLVQRIRIAIAPSDPNYVYAFAVDVPGGMYGIYKSTDAGASWTYINPGVNVLEYNDGSGSGGQGTYDLGFAVNPTDKNIVYTGGVNVWASTDGANTFNPVSHWTLSYGPTIHGDIHFIQTQPLTGNIFVCSDGGLYKTDTVVSESWAAASGGTPWPTSWTTISNGMAISSFYRISSSKNATGRLCVGAQDNATMYYDGFGWNTIFGGDGMDNYLDPVDDNVIIGSSQYGSFYFSPDGGVSSFNPGTDVLGEGGEWTSPIVADYNNYGTIYAGLTTVVNQSVDGGNTWNSLTPLPYNGIHDNEISALAVANTNANVIYATRRIRFEFNSPPNAYRTTDGGTSWTDITSNLPDSLYYTSVDVSQTDANTAYISLAGLVAGEKVYRTINGGTTWQNISYNLPNAPVNTIKTIPGTGALIVCTDFGVYMFDAASSLWVDKSIGLPNVIISDIDFNAVLNKAYVCTFGRGIWETDLSNLVGITSVEKSQIGIELFPSPNNGGFTIQLKDQKLSNEELNLEVIDITGKLVYQEKLSGRTSYKEQLDLKPGMYFAKIYGKNISGVKNFVVK